MIYILDTYYTDESAKTICVGIKDWKDKEATIIYDEIIEGANPYESGSFYKRELPCILSILEKIPLKPKDIIVVDGFVVLDDEGKNGLGGYLYDHLEGRYAVIGVAKNDFVNLQSEKRKLLRGESKKPLFITSRGIDLDMAFHNILSMDGEYRIPTILKLVDSKTREVI